MEKSHPPKRAEDAGVIMPKVTTKLTHMRNDWLELITTDPRRVIAERAGVSLSTINRLAATDKPLAETVLAVARAYEYPAVNALINAGIIDRHDVVVHARCEGLGEYTDAQLLHELLRRRLNDTA